MAKVETPTLDKIRSNSTESQAIGEFLEWLRSERGVLLAERKPASWSCEECGEVPKDEVMFVDWLSTDDAQWRHKAKFCKKVQEVLKKKRTIPLERYEGARVEHVPEGLYPAVRSSIRDLLYAYFEIDSNQEEQERRAVLETLRKATKS